ncbi:uncharacterized protein LOC131232396 [Magnolia sinica]|uniref:uncharacterized protein LOC131232396 n=1 Tax=Magnolia sinica TaxID=86752 RepID=UPI00265ABE25|nr:uncharacterized protein LOC131232396 [Magnolia sinica]
MGIDKSRLRPVKTPLHGFAGDKVISEGAISLPFTTREGQNQVTLLMDFLVVNVPSAHNVIMGWSSLNAMRAFVSTYHLMMKFPADGGVEYVRGDQQDSSTEDLVTVPLKDADPSRTIQLRSSLNSEQRAQMLTFLQHHKDVFAWSHQNMSGIPPEIMVHKLNVDPKRKPVKQKRKAFEPEKYAAIANEASKLLSVGFIEEIHYLN